jgi:hypothetical protein
MRSGILSAAKRRAICGERRCASKQRNQVRPMFCVQRLSAEDICGSQADVSDYDTFLRTAEVKFEPERH